MKITKNAGFLLLSIFLILYGLSSLFGLSFSGFDILMGILALVSGILILFSR
ncbi:MAG: hypothetical protein IBX69_09305 [Anaerolineales bacterium]|nr:hypothetical protein [Anaerolineales bacterium]